MLVLTDALPPCRMGDELDHVALAVAYHGLGYEDRSA